MSFNDCSRPDSYYLGLAEEYIWGLRNFDDALKNVGRVLIVRIRWEVQICLSSDISV